MYQTTSAHRAVNEYFRLLPKGVAADVVRLFADDAVVVPAPLPAAGPIKGSKAIMDLYEKWVSVPMRFAELRMHDSEGGCAVEIRAELGAGKTILEVVDVFDVNRDGKITRMAAYKR